MVNINDKFQFLINAISINNNNNNRLYVNYVFQLSRFYFVQSIFV